MGSSTRDRRWNAVMLLTALLLAATASAEEAVWRIGERALPPPAGASAELRGAIAASPPPDVAASRAFAGEIDWPAIIAARARERAIDLMQLGRTLELTIEADELAGVPVYVVTPQRMDPIFAERLFLYVHGGAYVFGGGTASVGEAAMIASRSGIRTIAIDYRMPPAHPFPAALDDTLAVYQEVLEDVAASSIAIGGTSAGGGLALAAVHRFKALGLELPGAIYAGTPWADLTKTGDTLFTNEGIDRVLVSYDGLLGAAARLYAGGHALTDPLLSPVYGDFTGFPATYLVTGTRDMFLSDTARTHRRLREAGVVADLNVYEGLSHAGYAMVPGSPEQTAVYGEMKVFLAAHLR
jgi:acetyl esterase/lipase